MEWDQIRDGGGQPVYQIVRQGIKPAKIAATLSRKPNVHPRSVY